MVLFRTAIGIDISKGELVVARAAHRSVWTVPNTPTGHAAIVAKIGTLDHPHVILEATGQWHIALCDALANAEIPYTQVDGYKMRNFARSQGRRAKSDQVDARMLATYGAIVQPEPTTPRPAILRALAALVGRREDLIADRTREKNRAKSTTAEAVIASVNRITVTLTEEIRHVEQQIQDLIASDPAAAARSALLRSVPGWGPVTATVVLALLPELGTLTRKQLSALVGVAPYNQESGTHTGSRRIAGGRAPVRKALYMATHSGATLCTSPVVRAHVAALQERGKPYKVAIIATVNRMLGIVNAMVRDNLRWEDTAASHGLGTIPRRVIA
jgi:transposase